MQVPRLFVEVIVRDRCCASVSCGVLSGWPGRIESWHQVRSVSEPDAAGSGVDVSEARKAHLAVGCAMQHCEDPDQRLMRVHGLVALESAAIEQLARDVIESDALSQDCGAFE